MTIPEFSSTSAPKRKNYSELFGFLSPRFMNEIRTGIHIPGAPSSPTAIANKKDDMGNAKMISIFQVSFH